MALSLALGGCFIGRHQSITALLFSAGLWGPFVMQSSLLWYSALGHRPPFISSDSPRSSQCRRFAQFPVFSLPAPQSGISLKAVNCSNNRVCLIHFLFLRIHCSLLLDFHLLKTFFYFLTFCLVFAYLAMKGKPCP